uniref:NKAP family protein CG6066-like n=1 Tax=Dermatophagoides pteronyssinus TaxID=6956 RepID=A0A6P6Y6V0_DERPT|nr:NKAP family protein CG6066-like [Dermatophagoides pteronyssinus]
MSTIYRDNHHHHNHRHHDEDDYRSDDYKHRRNYVDKDNSDYWIKRRKQRESIGRSGVDHIWNRSPTPTDDDDDDVKSNNSDENLENNLKRKKKHKHKHSDNNHHQHKSSKKEKKKKHKKERKHKKRRHSSSSSESEVNDDNNGDNQKIKFRTIEEEEFVREFNEKRKQNEKNNGENDADDIVGPAPIESLELNNRDFGKALLPGEGAAMAAFVTEGKRIPRRGEIGLTSDQIESFEEVGFVMSGSRHRRMEAVRIRKENQIYSADEKRALAMFNKEERTKRETKILTQFKEMIKQKQTK